MRLTRRGEIVFTLGLAFALVLGLFTIYTLSTSIHWTENGYCWGSFDKCYEGEGKK